MLWCGGWDLNPQRAGDISRNTPFFFWFLLLLEAFRGYEAVLDVERRLRILFSELTSLSRACVWNGIGLRLSLSAAWIRSVLVRLIGNGLPQPSHRSQTCRKTSLKTCSLHVRITDATWNDILLGLQ